LTASRERTGLKTVKSQRKDFIINDAQIGLQHFMELLDYDPPDSPYLTQEIWDKRAQAWRNDYNSPEKMKSGDRVQDTVDYLAGHGLLNRDYDVIDIGCGPGRFAVAFARTAHYVLGLDISEEMIRDGLLFAEKEGLNNVSFRACDFQSLDIDREGLVEKFDLVFSSLTPATRGMKGLISAMRMSRQYCCNISYIRSENKLEQRIMQDVFGRERQDPRVGYWHRFYTTFNVLFLMGYSPEVSYYRRRNENVFHPEPDRVRLFMEQMLPPHERTPENEERVFEWVLKNVNSDGTITETRNSWYARLLWDVRDKAERISFQPDN